MNASLAFIEGAKPAFIEGAKPQGEVECALVMQMAFTHRSENILTE